MKFLAKTIALPLTAAALLAASFGAAADTKESQLEDLARYQAVAGQPQPSFTMLSRNSVKWQPLGDRNLVYQMGMAKAYLLTLDADCHGLHYAQQVAIDSRGSRMVYANTDRVKIFGPDNPGAIDCKIAEIRPVDLKAYRKLKYPAAGK